MSAGRLKPITLLVRRNGEWNVWGGFSTMEEATTAYFTHIKGRGVTAWTWYGPSETATKMLADPDYDPDSPTPTPPERDPRDLPSSPPKETR